jgi:hydroxyacylglutathione hydrolase
MPGLTWPERATYHDPRVMLKYKLVVVGPLETNCYLAYCDETLECGVIDPGAEPDLIFPVIVEAGLKPVVILNTHGHIDHVGANRDIKEKFGIPLWIHALDSPLLENNQQFELSLFLGAQASPPADRLLQDGESVEIGRCRLEVIHTPGHTPGSVGFFGNDILFSGDTLFNGGVGRTDLPGGSTRDLEISIREKILTLPSGTVVLPGHGPWTTIGEERESNPFLG